MVIPGHAEPDTQAGHAERDDHRGLGVGSKHRLWRSVATPSIRQSWRRLTPHRPEASGRKHR